jgi:hypothetical protein
MKSLMIALSLTSAVAMAETGTFTVKGMHCSSCKDMVTEKVCKGEAGKDVESCQVKLTDEKHETGVVTIVSKPGTKVNVDAVKAGVAAAGSEYSVAKVEIKDMVAKELKSETTTTPETVTTTTTVETKTMGADGKPVVKTEKTKKIVKKMNKTAAAETAHTTNGTPAVTPTTPETK